MKNFLFAAVFMTAAVSFGKSEPVLSGVRPLKVLTAQVGQAAVQDVGVGQLVVDYSASKLSLSVELRPNCAPGMMCAQVIRILKAELPITSIKTDSCGIHTVIASKDDRPVDGSLNKVTFSDVTDMTCKTFVAVIPQATYESSFFDRLSGKAVSEKTKLTLAAVREQTVTAAPILKYEATAGFSPEPSVLTVTVDSFGEVKSVRRFFGSSAKPDETAVLATLSADGMQNLRSLLAQVAKDNALVDQQAGQPECVDAGSVEVIAFLHDVQVPIFRNSGCHTFNSGEWSASSLAQLTLGLARLAH